MSLASNRSSETASRAAFGTTEVARLLGVDARRVRAIVRAGLCRPSRQNRRLRFSFQDVILLRTAHGLLRAKIPARNVRLALTQLARQLAPGRPLTGVRIYADGKDIVVRDGRSAWKPETGQLILCFNVDELRRSARTVTAVTEKRRHKTAASPTPEESLEMGDDAMDWFELALDREQGGDLDGARAAYAEALNRDPTLSDAYVNLGRLAHEAGEIETAAQLYRQAIDADPEDPIPHYNLAIALEDQDDLPAAVIQYKQAIAIDSRFPDAHFNLSRILDRLGNHVQALRHLMIYKKMTRSRR